MNSVKTKSASSEQSSLAASGLALAGAISTTIANFGLAYLLLVDGSEFAGKFFFATALATILGNASSLGTATAIIYFLPEALRRPDPNPKHLIRLALGPVLAISMVAAIGVEIAGFAFGGDSNSAMRTLTVLGPAVPALALSASLAGATRGLGTMLPTVAINQVFRPLAQLILLAAVVFWIDDPSPTYAAIAWAIPILLGTIAFAVSTKRLGGFVNEGEPPVSSSEFWAYTRPRAASTAMQITLERVDVLLVKALAGDGAAGIYGTITRFVTAGNFLSFSISQAVAPNLRGAIFRARKNGTKLAGSPASGLLHQVTSWLVLILWPYFLVTATKAGFLSELLGKEARGGAASLTIISIGMLAASFAGPVDLALTMTGHSKLSMYLTGLALSSDVILGLILIPIMGIEGAAIAWAASVWIQKLFSTLRLQRTSGISGAGKPALVAAAIAVVAVLPISLLTSDSWPSLFITAAVSGAIYLPIVWLKRAYFGLVRTNH